MTTHVANPAVQRSAPAAGRGRRAYFPALDGVRAIAALMVIVFHFFQAHGQDARFFIGQTGVDLFFVLSGFLITLILLGARGETHAFRRFYMRRTLRIFPLYYGFLIGATCIGMRPSWQYWLYVQNFALGAGQLIGPPVHFWSLAVEEHFYLVWPLIALKVRRRYLPWIAVAFLLLSLTARIVRGVHGLDGFYPTECRLDGLSLGALLALAYEAGAMRVVSRYCWPVGALSLLAIGFMAIRYGGHHSTVFQVAKPLLFGTLYASAMGILLQEQLPRLNAALATRPLRATGRISYGMYVFHPAVIYLVLLLGVHSLLVQLALIMLATYAVAWLSWTVYEKQFIKLKARFE